MLVITTSAASANTALWALMMEIGYKETETADSWKVEKILPEGLREMGGPVRLRGFYVPVEAQAYVTRFLLVPDPSDCPFCGSNGYGISLEVETLKPVQDMEEGTAITVTGELVFDDSPETYRALYVTGARVN